jgi:PIN domain nuclease of toxin-antitoxin system
LKILLDTHCWLWMLAAPERLSEAARNLLVDPKTELLLSAASSWEIAIKFALGRLPLPEPPATYVPSRLESSRTSSLAIAHAHALHVATLPPHHRDPFDRLLVAQAQLETIPLLSADAQLAAYDVEIIWASEAPR